MRYAVRYEDGRKIHEPRNAREIALEAGMARKQILP